MYAQIVPVGNIYAGYLKIKGLEGCYYASSSDRMKVITKLLTYARLDGHIK